MTAAILYETHEWSIEAAVQFEKLSRVNGCDCWLLADSRTEAIEKLKTLYDQCFVFDVFSLYALPYAKITKFPHQLPIGHAHLPILFFYLQHPEYEFYWFIEYDVRYTGDWDKLFIRLSKYDADFISTHVRFRREEPGWPWWASFNYPQKRFCIPEPIRSFNTFYRISRTALAFLSEELKVGWSGHHEVLIATALNSSGCEVLDCGGDGLFVPPELLNSTYTTKSSKDGDLVDREGTTTLCWRPIRYTAGSIKDKLYHPVKPFGWKEYRRFRSYDARLQS